MKDNKEKESIYNFEAVDKKTITAEITYAVVCRATPRQITMLDDFLDMNNYKVRFKKMHPGFLRIVAVQEGEVNHD